MQEQEKWYILWSTTLRSTKLIEHIVYHCKAKLWVPTFTTTNLSGKQENVQIYPTYYFVGATKSQCYDIKHYIASRKYKGIFFLGENDKFAYLKDFEIDAIKYVERTYTMTQYLKVNPNFKVGTVVKVTQGPFAGIKGEIQAVKNTEVLLYISDKGTKLWCNVNNIKETRK